MKKNFLETEAWSWIKTFLELLLFGILITLAVLGLQSVGLAEEWDEHEEEFELAWVVCMPNDYVNIRSKPSSHGLFTGYLEPGDMVYLDGKRRNEFYHCVGLSTEAGEGWVHGGYLVRDEPEYIDRDAKIISNGRLAARKYVDGKRTRWLKSKATVHIYYWSEEWAVTNCGYIRSRFLEPEGET